jgi:hypothetical protein
VALLAAAILSSASCVATTYPSLRETLLNRAAYDLECPKEALSVIGLDEDTRAIEGCRQKATYVLVCGPADSVVYRCKWLANTANVTATAWHVTRTPIASP